MFKHFLVPVDGSELSQHAVTASLALARQLGARITGFVVEPDDILPVTGRHPSVMLRELETSDAQAKAHAAELLAPFAEAAAAAGVPFDSHYLRTTSIDRAIVSVAEERQCDLIVMATHGRGVFGELVFGSHTKNVMSSTRVPLLVLH